MDDETFEVLSNLNNDNIIPVTLSDLESDEDFETLKKNTNYIPNSHDCTYCFALGSFLTEYVVRYYGLDEVLYIDSDIIFYQDPKLIFDEIGDRSIGIMLHRHVPIGHHGGEIV